MSTTLIQADSKTAGAQRPEIERPFVVIQRNPHAGPGQRRTQLREFRGKGAYSLSLISAP